MYTDLQETKEAQDSRIEPEDANVSEMIKKLPMEKIYTVARCFQERFMGQMESPSSWKVVKLVFLRKPDAAPDKRIRSCRAIAETSVTSEWYASCILLRLEKEKGGGKVEESACWWSGWDKLPTPAGSDDEINAKNSGNVKKNGIP